jgi:hypothetical protein
LLIVGVLSGAMTLLLPAANGSSGRAFGLVMAGAILHLIMDDLEGTIGCGSTTFYPLYFGRPAGWHSQGNFATVLLVVSAIGIGLALGRRQKWPPLRVKFTRPRVLGAAALLVVALLLPLFFRQTMIERNAYYLAFAANPTAFEGQSVELCFSEVIGENPVVIEEFDVSFPLDTAEPLQRGEWVSVRGLYQQGMIHPTRLVRHRGFTDVGLSLVAAGAFVLLIFDPRTVWPRLKLRAIIN